jgi:ribosomal protein S18 acetylase RimI-like enzyme
MSKADLTIDAVAADRVDDVLDLFAGYLDFYGVAYERDAARAFLAARVARGESLVLAVRGADGVAVAFTQVYFGFSSLSLGAVWTLNDLYVDPAVRGSGAGRLLVRAVCRRAADAGALSVTLATAHDNATAQALYESEGFNAETGFRHYSRASP